MAVVGGLPVACAPSRGARPSAGTHTPSRGAGPPSAGTRAARVRVEATGDAALETEAWNRNGEVSEGPAACPVCFRPISLTSGLDARCATCRRGYPFVTRGMYHDLTVTAEAGSRKGFEAGLRPPGTEIFRNPAVGYAYERGWRQGFSWAGFPGVDPEFEMASRDLAEVAGADEVVIDLSCATGVFTRKLASSNLFGMTYAVDFSESMLEGVYENNVRDGIQGVVSVRGDAARLPFATGSVAAVHAGAAIHCWPQPELAMAEIARVLKPGGRAVLSTFLLSPVQEALGSALDSVRTGAPDELRQVLSGAAGVIRQGSNGSFRFWTRGELETLAVQCGFTDFHATVDKQFILFCVTKPEEEAEVVYSPPTSE